MAQSLGNFAKKMRKRATGVDKFANLVVRDATAQGLRTFVEVMPVDTSEAISNTRIGIGGPPIGTRGPHFAGKRGSTRSASMQKAIDNGERTLRLKQEGQTVYLSNTAPHIGDLDRGSSAQFAGGFTDVVILKIRMAAKAAARRLWK